MGLEATLLSSVRPTLGDAGGNGSVGNLDALMIQALFLGFADPGALATYNADLNRDGVVSNLDALVAQGFFPSLTRLPVGGMTTP